MFIEVSLKKIGPLLVSIKLVAAIFLTPFPLPITLRIGLITSG